MKAFILENFDTAAAVRDDVAEPIPADNEVLVRVHASSINPVDLRALGATELIDRSAELAPAIRQAHPEGVDAMLDLVNFAPDTTLLKAGGRLASPLGAAGEGTGRFNLMAQPTPENLQRLAALIDNKTLRVPIQHSYPLTQAAEALSLPQTSHIQGKLGLTLA